MRDQGSAGLDNPIATIRLMTMTITLDGDLGLMTTWLGGRLWFGRYIKEGPPTWIQ